MGGNQDGVSTTSIDKPIVVGYDADENYVPPRYLNNSDSQQVTERKTDNSNGLRSGRQFESGAYRDGDEDKLDFEGFFSPIVLNRCAQYLHKHRLQSNGCMRDSDNWQLGMEPAVYMKSAARHFMDWWALHDGYVIREEDVQEAICGVIFNAMGYLFEQLKAEQ